MLALNQISIKKLFEVRQNQHQDFLYLADKVPAGKSKIGKTAVSNRGHFLCLKITGSFETSTIYGEDQIDDGVCYLRGILRDGSNNQLFSDYIPLNLVLTPGRRKDPNSANVVVDVAAGDRADPASNLFYPTEFVYPFPANTDIIMEVKNDSEVDLSYSMCFQGIRVLNPNVVAGV